MRPQPKRGQPVKEEEEVEYDHSQEIKKLLNDYHQLNHNGNVKRKFTAQQDRRMGQEIVMVDPDNLAVKLPELI